MTAPLFVLAPGKLSGLVVGDLVEVGGDEGRHGVTVKRLRLGEAVSVTDGRGRILDGVVSELSGKDQFAVLAHEIRDEPVPPVQVTVVQALLKGERMELATEMLTEIGADRIVPWAAERCVVRLRSDTRDRMAAKLRRRVTEAAKQSHRAWIPAVDDVASTDDVIRLGAAADSWLVLHESALDRLSGTRLPHAGRIVVVVGPEGGLGDSELRTFAAAGARTVRMGPTVLRASTAATAALGWLLPAAGRW